MLGPPTSIQADGRAARRSYAKPPMLRVTEAIQPFHRAFLLSREVGRTRLGLYENRLAIAA